MALAYCRKCGVELTVLSELVSGLCVVCFGKEDD